MKKRLIECGGAAGYIRSQKYFVQLQAVCKERDALRAELARVKEAGDAMMNATLFGSPLRQEAAVAHWREVVAVM